MHQDISWIPPIKETLNYEFTNITTKDVIYENIGKDYIEISYSVKFQSTIWKN
uniref:Uncharacterized protein n=1 Tax=Arundo donax TaxID=35708 RepID=A0A0A9GK29_ARUDO